MHVAKDDHVFQYNWGTTNRALVKISQKALLHHSNDHSSSVELIKPISSKTLIQFTMLRYSQRHFLL